MKSRLCKLLVCLVFCFGSMGGIAMRPEQIEELMSDMNQPKIAITMPDESGKDDPIQKFLRLNGKME